MGFQKKVLLELRQKGLRREALEMVAAYGGTGCDQTPEEYADEAVKVYGVTLGACDAAIRMFQRLKKEVSLVVHMNKNCTVNRRER